MPADVDWILMGDFNFMRAPSDRNRPGGDVNDMLMFNEAISNQGLVELPLHGRKFSWSNMQQDPLLVKLDWFFTSASWKTSFPNTIVLPLAKPISDHLPCVIKIGTAIPKVSGPRLNATSILHVTPHITLRPHARYSHGCRLTFARDRLRLLAHVYDSVSSIHMIRSPG